MSYNLLLLRHSGPCVVTSANSTSQYGSPMVAARALSRGHFVGPHGALGHLAPSGLPLSSSGPESPGDETPACSQNHLYGQFASSADSGSPSPLSSSRPALKPRSGGLTGTVAQTTLSWL